MNLDTALSIVAIVTSAAVGLFSLYIAARNQDAAAMRHAKRAQTSQELRDLLLKRYGEDLLEELSHTGRLARELDGHVLRDVDRYMWRIKKKDRTYWVYLLLQISGGIVVALIVTAFTLSVFGITSLYGWILGAVIGIFVAVVALLGLQAKWGVLTRRIWIPDDSPVDRTNQMGLSQARRDHLELP